jgi:hypothetical protein
MKYIRQPLVFMVFVLLMVITTAQGQTSSWINLEGGPVYEIADDARTGDLSKRVVRIPVKLDPAIKPEDLKLRLLDVSFSQRYATSSAFPFAVAFELEATPAPVMIIELKSEPVLVHGEYALRIEATGGQQKPEVLTVRLSRPAATLEQIPKLVVEQRRGFLSAPDFAIVPIILNETGGKSRVSGLTPRATYFTTADGQAISGHLASFHFLDEKNNSKEMKDAEISPMGSIRLNYSLIGDFPYGASTGTVKLYAPQLIEPLTVTVEVRTRCPRYVIFGIILLGIFFSLLMRTYLPRQSEVEKARSRADDLLKLMEDERQLHPDATFLEKLRPIEEKLRADAFVESGASVAWYKRLVVSFIVGGEPAKITEAINAASTSLEAARSDLATRRSQTQPKLADLLKLTVDGRKLPEKISQTLELSRRQAQLARQSFERDDIKTADEVIEKARQEAASGFGNRVLEWCTQTQDFVNHVAEILLPMPVGAGFQQGIEEIKTLLKEVKNVQTAASLADLANIVGEIQNIHLKMRYQLQLLQYDLQHFYGLFWASLAEVRQNLPDKGAIVTLETEFNKVVGILGEVITHPERSREQLAPESLQPLKTAWRAAVERQMAGFKESEKVTITPLLNERKYHEAAQALAKVIQEKTTGGSPIEELESAGEELPVSDSSPSARPEPEIASSSPTAPMLLSTSIRLPEDLRGQSAIRLVIIQLLQILLVIALATGLGYLLNAKTFYGTSSELIGLFAWAFTLDLTIDSIVTLFGRHKKEPSS